MKKKALIISTVSRQFYLFEQANIAVLRNLGYEVHGAANFSDRSERLSEVDIIEHEIPFERSPISLKNIKAFKDLSKLLKNEKFDIIHCHSPVGGVIGRIAAKRQSDTKIIYTAHGFHFFRGAPLKNWLIYYPIEKFLSSVTDVLITINNEDFEIARDKFYMSKLFKVDGVGVDYEKFKPVNTNIKNLKRSELSLSENQKVLINVGELSNRKNQEMIIKAMAELIQSEPNLLLLLVGRGELEQEYKKMISLYKLENNVLMLGYRTDVQELMQASDIVISTSYQEGLPVNLMEALGVGKPIIATNCRGNRDIVKDSENGYLVELDNVEMLSEKISLLLNSPEKAHSFSEASLKSIEKYSKRKIMDIMYQIYSEVGNNYNGGNNG